MILQTHERVRDIATVSSK